MASSPITSWQIDGEKKKKKTRKQWQIFYFGAPKALWMMTAAMKLKDVFSLEGKI